MNFDICILTNILEDIINEFIKLKAFLTNKIASLLTLLIRLSSLFTLFSISVSVQGLISSLP